jgi:hypothetical protein
MEFISIMINGSQTRNVIENVPRIFLLTFIFWSLIFRSGFIDNQDIADECSVLQDLLPVEEL